MVYGHRQIEKYQNVPPPIKNIMVTNVNTNKRGIPNQLCGKESLLLPYSLPAQLSFTLLPHLLSFTLLPVACVKQRGR